MNSDPVAATGVTASLRPVKNSDVLPYAKKQCRSCRGVGVYRVNRAEKVCGCGYQRFLKQNQSKLIHNMDTNEWFWLV